MDELHEEIRQCRRCHLAETRIQAVPGQGPVPAPLMLIGEAPGKTEDERGQPFTGAAGRILDIMLMEAGLSRDQVFITSVIKCRPPKNRNPNRQEVAACSIHLDRQIALVNPVIIAVMGNVALQALFGPALVIGAVRGKIIHHEGRQYFPLFHPAAMLYNRSLGKTLKEDFCLLAEMVAQTS